MEQIPLREGETYIKLGQALKKAGFVSNGGEAGYLITNGEILLNGIKETQRGKKVFAGDVITCGTRQVQITA